MTIENQIAIQADDKEEYCPVCQSTMTYGYYVNIEWLECDNQECLHIIEGE